jgi:hypothetical protein
MLWDLPMHPYLWAMSLLHSGLHVLPEGYYWRCDSHHMQLHRRPMKVLPNRDNKRFCNSRIHWPAFDGSIGGAGED